MRKLPIAVAAAIAFDLGTFSVVQAQDYLLKLSGIDGETEDRPAPKAAAPKTYVDSCFWGECRGAPIPTINAAGCDLIGGVLVTIEAQAMCKVTPSKPTKPKVGVRIAVPIPGMSGSGATPPPNR
jgi:hypothetical protein